MKNFTKRLLTGVLTLLAFVMVHAQTNYYNKSTASTALQTLSSWGTNTDGSGTAPTSFTAANQVFNIINGTTVSNGASWTVSGTNSKVVLGSAAKPAIAFTANNTFTATVDITAASSGSNTLSLGIATPPTFGTLNSGSTVIYALAGNQTVGAATYGNLSFTATSGIKTFGANISALGTMTISGANNVRLNNTSTPRVHTIGNLVMSAGTLDGGSVNSGTTTYTSTLNVTGNFTKTGGTITNSSASDFNAITFNGGGAQSFSNTGTSEYNIWTITNNSTLNLATAFPISGFASTSPVALTIDAGSTLNAAAFQITADNNALLTINGTIKTANTAGLSGAAGTTLSSTNSPSLTLGSASTVEYNAVAAQAVTARSDYANVVITGNSIKTAGGAMTLSGDLTINSTATFAAGALTHNIAGDFINGGTFTQSTSTINLNGTVAQLIGGTTTTTFNNLIINKASGLASLGNSISIGGTLTLTSGNLDIANSNMLLGSAAVVGTFSATRMIYASGTGELRRTYAALGSYTFPIGEVTGTAEYSPVTVNVTSGGTAGGYVGVSVVDAKHPSNNSTTNFLTRYWNVNISGAANATATITGTYIAGDVTGAVASNFTGQLRGVLNVSTNPWIKFAALSGTTLTATGAVLTPGSTSAFTGIGTSAVTVSGGGTFCENSALTLTANPTGGNSPYIYAWSNGLGTASTATPPTTPTGSTTYSVTVTDGNGLTASGSTGVTILPNVVASISISSTATTICGGSSVTFTATPVNPGASPAYQWFLNGTTPVGTNSTTYTTTTLSDNDSVTCRLTTAAQCTTGSPATSNAIVMTVEQPAIANAGLDGLVCSSSPAYTLSGSFGGSATSATWTGAGTFSPDATTMNATYTPTAGEIAAGSATLTLTTDDPAGLCGAASDTMIIVINTAASVTTSGDQIICSDSSASISGTRSGTGVTSSTWTSPTGGTFGNAGSLSTTYTPSAADKANGSVVLTLTTNDPNGPCGAASASLTLTVNPQAIVSAGSTQTICANETITLAGSFGGSATSVTWSGTGTFADVTNPTSAYTPPITANGPIVLTLTTNDPAGICPAASSTVTINVRPVPVATGVVICQGSPSAPMTSPTVCADNPSVTLAKLPTSAVNSGTGTAWGSPANVLTDNNASATLAGNTSNTVTSQPLLATNFAFAIPANAIVHGIQASISRSRNNPTFSSGEARDTSLRLLKAGTATGSNYALTGNNWTTTETVVNYGGSTDLWGTTWTAADVNASNFGLAFVANITQGLFASRTASVDYVQLAVTYTVPGDLNWYTVSSGGTSIGSGSSFNPVGVAGSGLSDTNTAGTTTYYVECSTVAGCRTPVTYVINELPSVAFTMLNPVYCADAAPVALTANHLGGTFTGSGVTDNGGGFAVFNPAAATVGPVTITYSYTDGNTCANSVSQNVTVYGLYPFYADNDGDSYGAGSAVNLCSVNAATAPAGYSVNNTDCNDADATKHATYPFYADADGDSYGAGSLQSICAVNAATPPAGYTLNGSDCNDNDASVYQSATLYIDVDADGYDNGTQVVCYGASVPAGYSLTTSGSDCNDNDATKHNQYPFYADTDGDGFGAGSSVNVCAANASTPPAGYSTVNTDCAPADAAMHASYPFYVDADGDTYGSATVANVCAVSALTPPAPGYVLNSTDCDDTKASVHPGAVEIGYNLIDDDCDGLIDEGFPPKNTTISGAMCNTILPAIDSQLYADNVPGAQGYRWRVTTMTGISAGQVQLLDTPLRVMKLTQLANYAFKTQYKIELAVYYAGYLQPFQSSNCTVTTPDTTTKLTVCGQTLTAMTNSIYANIVPYGTGYRFRVTDPANPANTQTMDRTTRDFRMNLITAFTVQYGKVYNVEVAVKNTDGTYLSFGQTCQVTTPVFPTTSLDDATCDDYQVADSNTQIYAYSVPGAAAYVFKLSGPGLPGGSAEVTKLLRAFRLSDFTGLIPSATYNVQVRVVFNFSDAPGPYGKTCTVIAPGLSRPSTPVAVGFKAVAYPNPFADNFSLNVTTASDDNISVKVYDMTGRLLETRIVNADEIKSLELGDSYPAGVYNVIVGQSTEVKTLRVIKR